MYGIDTFIYTSLADKLSAPALMKFSNVSISSRMVSSGTGASSTSGELPRVMQHFHPTMSDFVSSEHGAPPDRTRAVDTVVQNAAEYSMDQYASKVVEKCLKIGGNEFLERYLDRVCEGRSDRPRIPLIDSKLISQIRRCKTNSPISCERSIRELPCPMDISACLTSA